MVVVDGGEPIPAEAPSTVWPKPFRVQLTGADGVACCGEGVRLVVHCQGCTTVAVYSKGAADVAQVVGSRADVDNGGTGDCDDSRVRRGPLDVHSGWALAGRYGDCRRGAVDCEGVGSGRAVELDHHTGVVEVVDIEGPEQAAGDREMLVLVGSLVDEFVAQEDLEIARPVRGLRNGHLWRAQDDYMRVGI